MSHPLITVLKQQFDIAWQLTDYHLHSLSTEECLWRPGPVGLHVSLNPEGLWQADWPDHEGYDLGPSSIGWLTWHLTFWWEMVLNHSFGDGTLSREQVTWPGTADALRTRIYHLKEQWQAALDRLSDADLDSQTLTHWPLQDRPFSEIVAWVNIELAKNAAEIGYARFLYAVRNHTPANDSGLN